MKDLTMGSAIPVHFALLLDKTQIPLKQQSWQDCIPLIETIDADPIAFDRRLITSRNWWLLDVFDTISRNGEINSVSLDGAEFIVFQKDMLQALAKKLHTVISLKSEIPHLTEVPYIQDIFLPELPDALEQAQASHDLFAYDSGPQAQIDFWSFIKSLLEITENGIRQNRLMVMIAVKV